MYLIEDFMLKTKDERQAHLKLDEPCLERGGASMYLKGLLAHLMGTTIPSGKKIHVCHACHNGACSNPNHIYWGTSSENKYDADGNGGTTLWERMVAKYGLEAATEMQRRSSAHASKAGHGNQGTTKSQEHKDKIAESMRGRKRGPYKKAA